MTTGGTQWWWFYCLVSSEIPWDCVSSHVMNANLLSWSIWIVWNLLPNFELFCAFLPQNCKFILWFFDLSKVQDHVCNQANSSLDLWSEFWAVFPTHKGLELWVRWDLSQHVRIDLWSSVCSDRKREALELNAAIKRAEVKQTKPRSSSDNSTSEKAGKLPHGEACWEASNGASESASSSRARTKAPWDRNCRQAIKWQEIWRTTLETSARSWTL